MKNISLRNALMASAVACLVYGAPAFATEGYFQNGAGAKSKAVAGADVAAADDAMGASLNPAGIVGIGDELALSATLFNPVRGFKGTTQTGYPSFTPDGKVESSLNYFPVPAFGYVRQIDDMSAFAVNMYGNGGMTTSYNDKLARTVYTSPETSMPCEGVFCGGKVGVNLTQLFVSATYARKLNDKVTVGVSPMFAYQMFKSYGLGMFDQMGAMYGATPGYMTNNGFDDSHGFGVKIGLEAKLTPNLDLGISYQPKINMSRFKSYSGLFADRGDFDIPDDLNVGFAYKLNDNTKFLLAYRHIGYSDVGAIGNSTSAPAWFGMAGGPGFGWDDVDVYKLGVIHKLNDAITLRGGISSNNNPIGPEDVTLNILAPGVQKLHLAGGVNYKTSDANSFDFGITYSPESKVRGIEVTPAGANPYHTNELYMHQLEVTFGWVHKFGK